MASSTHSAGGWKDKSEMDMHIYVPNAYFFCPYSSSTYSEEYRTQTELKSSRLGWVWINYFPLPAVHFLVVHASGSLLYYKLQPVVWIALKDRSTKKGITYPCEGQFATLG